MARIVEPKDAGTPTTARDYKGTLNLPQTDFPMRANSAERGGRAAGGARRTLPASSVTMPSSSMSASTRSSCTLVLPRALSGLAASGSAASLSDTGASVGLLTEAANTVGAQLVGALPGSGGQNAAQMLAGGCKAQLLFNNEPGERARGRAGAPLHACLLCVALLCFGCLPAGRAGVQLRLRCRCGLRRRLLRTRPCGCA